MSLPGTASVVVIGGGVVGCSIAYHLARRGMRDVVVLGRETGGSGHTSTAAGGVRPPCAPETDPPPLPPRNGHPFLARKPQGAAEFHRGIRHRPRLQADRLSLPHLAG